MAAVRIRSLAHALLLLLVAGCGADDDAQVARDEEPPDPELIDFDPRVNVCPVFVASLVLPQTVTEGEPALVGVRAVDPDSSDSTLKFAWSAPSGEFTQPLLPVTEYRCTEEGPQLLSVVASDVSDCDTELSLDIVCAFE